MMRPHSRVTIRGKRWKLRRSRCTANDGLCKQTKGKDKTLVVDSQIHGHRELDIHVHECLHACAFEVLGEKVVAKTATEAASILWMLAWRKQARPDKPAARERRELRKALRIILNARTDDVVAEDWAMRSAVDISEVLLKVGYRKT